MFNAEIYEFGSSVLSITTFNDELFTRERDTLLKGPHFESFLDLMNIDSLRFYKNGVWLTKSREFLAENSVSHLCSFKEFTDDSSDLPGIDIPLNDYSLEVNDGILSVVKGDRNGIIKKDFFTEKEIFVDGNYYLGLVVNDNVVVARSRSKGLVAYDLDNFNELWSVKSDKKPFTSVRTLASYPQKYNNTVIMNVGEENSEKRGKFELNSYNISNGELVWSQIFETSPSTGNVINNKVYLIVGTHLIVVDAATGNIEVNIPHSCSPLEDTNTYQGAVFPLNDLLLLMNPIDGFIVIYSDDGKKVLQTISVPKPYIPSVIHKPVTYQESFYIPLAQPLHSNFVGGALIRLNVDSTSRNQVSASIQQRPSFYCSLVKDNNSGCDFDVITVSHDNLSEIIRYATLTLKETAYKISSLCCEDFGVNHSGVMKLIVDIKPLSNLKISQDKLLDELVIIKKRVEQALKVARVFAGDKKLPFKVSVELK